MERPTTTMLRIGTWCVNPAAGQISRDGETARVEVRTMRLLVCLAERAGEVVSIEDLLTQVWPEVSVAPDSVYQAVASLRRLLGDDPKEPIYIATVPRLGYRLVARVSSWAEQSDGPRLAGADVQADGSGAANDGRMSAAGGATGGHSTPGRHWKPGFLWAAAPALGLVLVGAFLWYGKVVKSNRPVSAAIAAQPERSIAVLPFLDLTEGMKEEEFADGMTEELIDKLSKVPGLRVPPPTSSFYFKGKLWPLAHGTPQLTVADVAKALGVAYVLDGSVRKSHGRLRVAARLIRADNGFVVWSETYDRPFDDILVVQDDIAGEVTKALRASIEGKPNS